MEEKIKEKKEKEMLTISKKEFDELRKRLESLERDKDMLLQVADKKQLSLYYSRHRDKVPAKVMLRTMMTRKDKNDPNSPLVEKVVLGWRTIQDEVYQDPATMRWVERQRLEVLYEDGTSEEFHLMDYVRKYRQVEAEVRNRIVDEETGDVALKVVRLDNGKEYTIGINFIN